MKKSLRVVSAVMLGSLLLSSCDKCTPATTTELQTGDTDWLVYDRGDSVRFVNESNMNVTYVCVGVSVSNVPAEGYSIDDDCVEKVNTQVAAILQDTQNKNLALATLIERKPEELALKLAVENRGSWEIDENNPKYPTLELDNTTYTNVYEVKLDSTKAGDIKRLLYTKTKGFVRVEFYDGKLLQLK